MTNMELAQDLPDRRSGDLSPPGEEELRFIRNFHDVFLSIGIAMFAVGLGFVSTLAVGNFLDLDSLESARKSGWLVAGVSFANAVVMWLMAEIFARSRRLFLPAIVILVAFVWFFLSGVSISYIILFSDQNYDDFDAAFSQLRALPLVVSLAAAVAIFIYYFRMKLPFAMGLGGLAVAAAGVSLVAYMEPDAFLSNFLWLQLAGGVFLFLLGVYFDARDPERRTRLSDNGFWLHFFAAPLIFSSVATKVSGGGLFGQRMADAPFGQDLNTTGAAAATLGVVFVFAVISLLINRRALLVSGLISAAIAIAILVRNSGLDGAWTAGVTLLLLGAAMVLLGGGWHSVRRILVAPFPKSGPISRIVPPENGDRE